MRINILILSILVLVAPIASAQSDQREQLVKQITSTYSNADAISADSPMIDRLLEAAKSANRQVSEQQWKSVKTEVASAFKSLMQDMLGATLQTALADFTVNDLSKLASILEDPIYKRFQVTMSSPMVQKQVLASQPKMGLQMIAVINTVLASHGLKQVH